MKSSFFLGLVVGALAVAFGSRLRDQLQKPSVESLLDKLSDHVEELEERTAELLPKVAH